MHIHQIRKHSLFEECDHVFLKNQLKAYAQPRQKIQQFLKKGDLVRVKKGLYVFGESARQDLYCLEHLANLIYGPSVISLEYALSFYGWIPEKVTEITSITTGRNKLFKTPLGRFRYQHQHPKYFFLDIRRLLIGNRPILISSPEKALIDLLYFSSYRFKSVVELQAHLESNLRIPRDILISSKETLLSLSQLYLKPYASFFKQWGDT